MYEGWNLFWRIVGLLLIVLVLWIITSVISGTDSGTAAYILISAVFWSMVVTAAVFLLMPDNRVRATLVAVPIMLIVLLSARAVFAEREPVGFKAMNRGENSWLLRFGNWINDPFYRNHVVQVKHSMTCDELVADKYDRAVENADIAFKNGNIAPGFDTPEAFYRDLKIKAEQQKDAGLRACTLQLDSPQNTEVKVTTVTTVPAPKPAPKKRVVRRRIPRCPIICRG